ncbi:hypothetical protein D3C86_952480 [compost metagenome]
MYYLVQDDAMLFDRIRKGDILVIEPYRDALNNHDIFLVEIGQKKYIRRVTALEEGYSLVPSNKTHDEIKCNNFKVVGIVVKSLMFFNN